MHSPLQTPPRVHVRLQGPSTPQSIRAASLTPPASCPPFSRRSQCSSQKLQASGLSPCPARGVAVSAQFSNFGTEDAATDAAETLARARREAIDDVIELGPSPQTLQRTAVASGMGVESTPGRSASPFNQSIAITDRAVVAASAVRRSQAPRRGVILDAFANNTPAGGPASSPRASSARTATATRTSSRSTSYRRHALAAPKPLASPISLPSALNDRQLLSYERDGFLVTRSLLTPETVTSLRTACDKEVAGRKLQALRQRVRVLCPAIDPDSLASEAEARNVLKRHATDELGFLQFFNVYRTNAAIARVVLGPELAATAAQLLGARRVRVYQSCMFLKEPGFAETNWHSDLRMAPFDTNAFVTAWVPLRPILGAANVGGSGEPDSGLMFAAGSHRDFALPFWHEMEGRDLSDRGYDIKDTGPMDLGDVSWHHGWTLHCAAPQPRGTPPRLAMSVAFIADGARVLARRSDPTVRASLLHDEDAESYGDWLHALTQGKGRDGVAARHRLLPVVWPPEASEAANFPVTL